MNDTTTILGTDIEQLAEQLKSLWLRASEQDHQSAPDPLTREYLSATVMWLDRARDGVRVAAQYQASIAGQIKDHV